MLVRQTSSASDSVPVTRSGSLVNVGLVPLERLFSEASQRISRAPGIPGTPGTPRLAGTTRCWALRQRLQALPGTSTGSRRPEPQRTTSAPRGRRTCIADTGRAGFGPSAPSLSTAAAAPLSPPPAPADPPPTSSSPQPSFGAVPFDGSSLVHLHLNSFPRSPHTEPDLPIPSAVVVLEYCRQHGRHQARWHCHRKDYP